MARKICPQCQRPEKICVCDFITPIHNAVEVGILQHPTEVKQMKGTATLAALSLQNCHLWVGESLQDTPELVKWLNDAKPVYLLYPPSEDNNNQVLLSSTELSQKKPSDYKVLVIDGTWRKTYKIMQLNPALQALRRVTIQPEKGSQYIIRKQKDARSLSTIEAIVCLLGDLEQNTQKFTPALTAFEQMQQQQMAFRKP